MLLFFNEFTANNNKEMRLVGLRVDEGFVLYTAKTGNQQQTIQNWRICVHEELLCK